MNPPNWKEEQVRLTRSSAEAIAAFATEHADVECCHFAFDSEPCYGYVLLGFDTTPNSLKKAQALEKYAVERRQRMLANKDSWKNAEHFLNTPVLVPFGTTGDFEFQFFRELKFPGWQEYAESADYPQRNENENDYLEGNFRILVWRVVEDLIVDGAFDCLNKSKPFLVSYGLHDQEQCIIRILDWPTASK